MVEISGGRGTKASRLLVCSSCARAMRGKHKLEKVNDNVDFVCAMGSGEALSLSALPMIFRLRSLIELHIRCTCILN